MGLKGIISYAHTLLKDTVTSGDIVVDATCGNGSDTLFLAKLVGDTGHVYSFDIQKQAIETTKARLTEANVNHVTYIEDSHAAISTYIPSQEKEKISAAIFNLGYLPRSDKSIITKGDSTIAAVTSLLSYLKKGGLIVLVIYHGHPGGKEEKDAVLQYVSQLSQDTYSVLQYGFINQINNPPFIVAIEKKKYIHQK